MGSVDAKRKPRPPRVIEIREADNAKAFDDFLRVPWPIYCGSPCWVPPLLMERRAHLGARNPYFHHARVRFFVAYRGGLPVGRISAQIDALTQDGDRAGTGHFGLLEAADEAVLGALLAPAEAWLAREGMVRVMGPYSLSINDEVGLLIEGFDTPPRLLMNYALPFYAETLKRLGYAKAKDLLGYRRSTAAPLPEKSARLAMRAESLAGLRVRPLRLRRFREELAVILEIFNDAWSDNWGFLPMTAAEVEYMADNLRPIIRPELVQIAEIDGDPVAMIVALPDLNQAIADLNGRLLPFGWAKLAWRLKVRGLTAGRVIMMGVRRSYRGGFLGSALALHLVQRLHDEANAVGIKDMELSWVLEDNWPIRRLIEATGGAADKRYRIYQKTLSRATPA